MRVAITGSNGLLGTKIVQLLLSQPNVQPAGISRGERNNGFLGAFDFEQIDLSDAQTVDHSPLLNEAEVILHTAAMTDVDGCERDPDRAWRENVEATRHLTHLVKRTGARLVYVSTEYVFDGKAGPYTEDDPPNPIGVYGRTKLIAEQETLDALPQTAVGRTTILYGIAQNARPNFVTWLAGHLASGKRARIVDDQVGSPTLVDNLAEMVWALGQDPSASGIFNTVGATVIDRLEFAYEICDELGLDKSLIDRTDTASLAQAAARPLQGGLRMEKFQARFPTVNVLGSRAGLAELHRQMDAQPKVSP